MFSKNAVENRIFGIKCNINIEYYFGKIWRNYMKTTHVKVLPYDPQWKSEFEKIKKELESVIGDDVISIEHVGSTAVAGLSSKPCIDIDVVIKDYTVLDKIILQLKTIGYIHEGDLGIKGREAFCYENKPHLLPHHLYVCPENSRELHRHTVFRDYLRTHPEAVHKYSVVKEQAAYLYPENIEKYMEYKSSCIEALYKLCGLV